MNFGYEPTAPHSASPGFNRPAGNPGNGRRAER